MWKTPPIPPLFFISLFGKHISDAIVFLGAWQCSDPSDSLANPCSVPPSSVRTGLCIMSLHVSHSTLPAPKEKVFFKICSYPKMHPLVFEQDLGCSVWGEVSPGLGTALTAPRRAMSLVALTSQGAQLHQHCVFPKTVSLILLPVSQHFWVILGSGGLFNFPLRIVLASLISLGFTNVTWRLALTGIAVLCSLKEGDRLM